MEISAIKSAKVVFSLAVALFLIEQGRKNATLADSNLKFWWSAELGGQPAPHVYCCIYAIKSLQIGVFSSRSAISYRASGEKRQDGRF